MAEHYNQIQVEKINLLEDELDHSLRKAFSDSEAQYLEFGIDWLKNLANHALDENDRPVLYIARLSADNFVACPMKLNTHTRQCHSLGTFYTSLYSPVIGSDAPQALFTALFRYLARNEKISALTLSPMDIESPIFNILRKTLIQAGWRGAHTYFCCGNWINDLEVDSYNAYLESLPSQLKNTIGRKTRKFIASGKGKLEIVESPESLATAIERFNSVYRKSWKQEEPYQDFIPELLRLAARRGWLRLGIASYDDIPVAGQIWLVWGNKAHIFKLAYHEEYKKLSPGTVLTAFMMKHVIDTDAVDGIDYLTGDDPYKKDWMTLRRERYGIAAYNARTVRGGTAYIGYCLKNLLKKLR